MLAKELMPAALDHVLTMLFDKTHFYEQMSISNSILEQFKNRQVKEVIEASLYINSQDQPVGEIRSSENQNIAGRDTTVFESIVGWKVDEAVRLALKT